MRNDGKPPRVSVPPASQGGCPEAAESLEGFVRQSRRLLVLTGAGCSTVSGIPDYRDASGEWKHRRPVQFRDFLDDASVRRRYWGRSVLGWPVVGGARPNPAHRALAALETAGVTHFLITQNVDGLHQKAGSSRVVDLHGRLDAVCCMGCGRRVPRAVLQVELEARNPDWQHCAALAPDGDADLEDADFDAFEVLACSRCGGVLKPDVVFFGETVPRERVRHALERFEESDALLVIGSSLMVWSGYRFVRAAVARGMPVAVLNVGRTRADEEISLKVEAPCEHAVPELAQRLGVSLR